MTVTRAGARAKLCAACNPPNPAPTMTIRGNGVVSTVVSSPYIGVDLLSGAQRRVSAVPPTSHAASRRGASRLEATPPVLDVLQLHTPPPPGAPPGSTVRPAPP